MPRKCVVTGVTGQDGFYLTRLLRQQGDKVYGVVRRSSRDTERLQVPDGIEIIDGDITDPGMVWAVAELEPDEIYNLAAFSHVGDSFKHPISTFQANAAGAVHMLEAARISGARFYQASTSEIYGNAAPPQSESTPLDPRSPYAIAKAAAYRMVRIYREAHGVFACNGILFNHESPMRGADFVTQKVARFVAMVDSGHIGELTLGSLDSRRDWGHAEDYVKGMVAMLRHDDPDDYVLATGVSYSVRDLLDMAFGLIGIGDWRPFVRVSESLFRPCEVNHLRGDASKAKRVLGWEPTITLEDMLKEMIHAAAVPARRLNVG